MAYNYPRFTKDQLPLEFKGTRTGERFPAFELDVVGGGTVSDTSLAGTPYLLSFASISCPPAAASLEFVLKRIHRDHPDLPIVTVYTREAHPGEHYPAIQDASDKARRAAALQEAHALPWTVAIDSVDGDLHRRVGANPASAYLVDADGVVVYWNMWASDKRLRAAVKAFRAGRPLRREADLAKMSPMNAMALGMAVMRRAGPAALRDADDVFGPPLKLARIAPYLVFLPAAWRGIGVMLLPLGLVVAIVALVLLL